MDSGGSLIDQTGPKDMKYKQLVKGCWIKSKTLKLEKAFVEFLENEKMEIDKPILSDHLKGVKDGDNDDSDSGEWDDDDKESSNVIISEVERFPDFNKKLREVLQEFGNSVFVKLDGMAAKDMRNWVVDLKCQNLNDIYQILKFSDLFQDYIDKKVNEEKSYDQMQLTMSRWYSLNHSMEFVLEIKESRLVSVSQRRLENYYPFLQKEGNLQEILDSIEIFLQNKLKEDTLNLLPDHCVIDVYIDPNSEPKKVLILGIEDSKLEDKLILKTEREGVPTTSLSSKNNSLQSIEFYVLKNDSDARYQIWSQDYPAEFLEMGNKGQAFETFLEAFAKDNLQKPE